MSWTRRAAIGGVAAGIAAPAFGDPAEALLGPGAEFGWDSVQLASRVGPAVSPNVRFPMCSTFKWLLAACVLSRVDRGLEDLERRVPFEAAEVLDYAPAVKANLARAGGWQGQMTVDALCDAAVTLSDNTAANLLLTSIGGPNALTAWLRGHGGAAIDAVTRLDRIEPALNSVLPGDQRDTTTPGNMLRDLNSILFEDVLKPATRKRLMQWMLDCKTGDARLKAGLPHGWRIAHKTGTWTYDPGAKGAQRAASGDVGVLIPPDGAPILVAAYTAGSTRPQAQVDAWFASVARRLTEAA